MADKVEIDWNLVESEIPIASWLIRQGSTWRDIPPRTLDTPFRGSSIGYICPRQEVLCSILDVHRQEEINPHEFFIFALGHGIHEAFQRGMLEGIIVGAWRCLGCSATYGDMARPIRRPDRCLGKVWNYRTGKPERCPNENWIEDVVTDWHLPGFRYEELNIYHENPKIYSHPDALLWRGASDPPVEIRLDDPYLELLEIKSAGEVAVQFGYNSSGSFRNNPYPAHFDQAQLYMYLLGVKRGRILYIDKGGRGIRSSLIEHHFNLKPMHVEKRVMPMIIGIEEGIRKKDPTLAKRVCKNDTCARARACPVSKQCWEEDEAA